MNMGSRFTELIVDALDPSTLADFWSAVLGWQRTDRYEGAIEIADPKGSTPTMVFVPVSDRKRSKNRLHLDLNPVGCEQQAEVERLTALGAHSVDIGQGDQTWVVLADPEGNEFCVLRDRMDRPV
jgi:hypothetical protein